MSKIRARVENDVLIDFPIVVDTVNGLDQDLYAICILFDSVVFPEEIKWEKQGSEEIMTVIDGAYVKIKGDVACDNLILQYQSLLILAERQTICFKTYL